MTDAGRRSYDGREVDPIVEAFVERRLIDTRHELRGEFTAAMVGFTNQLTDLHSSVTKGNLHVATTFTELNATLKELAGDVADMKPLAGRVVDLERADSADRAAAQAIDRFRAVLWKVGLGLGGLIVAVASVVVAIVS